MASWAHRSLQPVPSSQLGPFGSWHKHQLESITIAIAGQSGGPEGSGPPDYAIDGHEPASKQIPHGAQVAVGSAVIVAYRSTTVQLHCTLQCVQVLLHINTEHDQIPSMTLVLQCLLSRSPHMLTQLVDGGTVGWEFPWVFPWEGPTVLKIKVQIR